MPLASEGVEAYRKYCNKKILNSFCLSVSPFVIPRGYLNNSKDGWIFWDVSPHQYACSTTHLVCLMSVIIYENVEFYKGMKSTSLSLTIKNGEKKKMSVFCCEESANHFTSTMLNFFVNLPIYILPYFLSLFFFI